uniref:Uncharacterized protein n=1 Tax=Gossypium raimondii TaxID=29730 RepID=A0A0D2PSN0_GOSRA|nr:hypothetical protein B456_008G107800 [Gossypium raimondii]
MALKRGLSSVGVQRSRSSGSRLPIVILFFFSILTLLVFFVGQGLYISSSFFLLISPRVFMYYLPDLTLYLILILYSRMMIN